MKDPYKLLINIGCWSPADTESLKAQIMLIPGVFNIETVPPPDDSLTRQLTFYVHNMAPSNGLDGIYTTEEQSVYRAGFEAAKVEFLRLLVNPEDKLDEPLTVAALAEALDCFHNSALASLQHDQASGQAREAVCAIVEGFNAVAENLRGRLR